MFDRSLLPPLKRELMAIWEKAESTEFKLEDVGKCHLKEATRALIYIVDNIDTLKDTSLEGDDALYFLETNMTSTSHIPIHLSNYRNPTSSAQEKNKETGKSCVGEYGITIMIDSLPKMFVTCFNAVKGDSEKLKTFCEKLSGICIDARTRVAFDYAMRGATGKKPTLRNLIDAQAQKMDNEARFTYFSLLTALLTDNWGTELAEDKDDKEGPSPKVLNSDANAKVHKLLTSIFALMPSTDFPIYYSKTPNHLQKIFLDFLLKLSGSFLIDLPSLASESCDQYLFEQMMLGDPKPCLLERLFQEPGRSEIEPQLVRLVELITPTALIRFMQTSDNFLYNACYLSSVNRKKLFFSLINKYNVEHALVIIKGKNLFERLLKNSPSISPDDFITLLQESIEPKEAKESMEYDFGLMSLSIEEEVTREELAELSKKHNRPILIRKRSETSTYSYCIYGYRSKGKQWDITPLSPVPFGSIAFEVKAEEDIHKPQEKKREVIYPSSSMNRQQIYQEIAEKKGHTPIPANEKLKKIVDIVQQPNMASISRFPEVIQAVKKCLPEYYDDIIEKYFKDFLQAQVVKGCNDTVDLFRFLDCLEDDTIEKLFKSNRYWYGSGVSLAKHIYQYYLDRNRIETMTSRLNAIVESFDEAELVRLGDSNFLNTVCYVSLEHCQFLFKVFANGYKKKGRCILDTVQAKRLFHHVFFLTRAPKKEFTFCFIKMLLSVSPVEESKSSLEKKSETEETAVLVKITKALIDQNIATQKLVHALIIQQIKEALPSQLYHTVLIKYFIDCLRATKHKQDQLTLEYFLNILTKEEIEVLLSAANELTVIREIFACLDDDSYVLFITHLKKKMGEESPELLRVLLHECLQEDQPDILLCSPPLPLDVRDIPVTSNSAYVCTVIEIENVNYYKLFYIDKIRNQSTELKISADELEELIYRINPQRQSRKSTKQQLEIIKSITKHRGPREERVSRFFTMSEVAKVPVFSYTSTFMLSEKMSADLFVELLKRAPSHYDKINFLEQLFSSETVDLAKCINSNNLSQLKLILIPALKIYRRSFSSDASESAVLMRQVIDYLVNNARYSDKRFITALKAIFILAHATTSSSQDECKRENKADFKLWLQPLIQETQRDHETGRTFCFNKSRLVRILEPAVSEKKATAEQSRDSSLSVFYGHSTLFQQQKSATRSSTSSQTAKEGNPLNSLRAFLVSFR